MKRTRHPLDETFLIDNPQHGEEDELADFEITPVEIPEEEEKKNLELVISLALKQYKEIVDLVQYVEPKSRLRYLELAEKYLGQAKDALYKKGQLTNKTARKTAKGEQQEPIPQAGTITREELEEMGVRAIK